LTVALERGFHSAALRYFSAAGGFAAAASEALGGALPQPLRAAEVELPRGGGTCILAWRSPTDTLLLTKNESAFADLGQRLASETDGCLVDQTGGLEVVRAEGPRSTDLLVRLGACTAIPALGEARTGRLAELTVLSACVREGEWLLIVERVYADHLLEWIRATVADFQ
jgi:sarcosine oxidase gamma subunit